MTKYQTWRQSKRLLEHSKRPLEHSKRPLGQSKRPLEHSKRPQEQSKRPLEHSKRPLERQRSVKFERFRRAARSYPNVWAKRTHRLCHKLEHSSVFSPLVRESTPEKLGLLTACSLKLYPGFKEAHRNTVRNDVH